MTLAPNLSHIDQDGRARMVDISDKAITQREAIATGQVRMALETLHMAQSGLAKKGDVITTAELAGIMAAKRTSELIPLCHPLILSKIEVSLSADDYLPGFQVRALVRCRGQTGVEMEALTAVSLACLTLYDMLKAVDRDMVIEKIGLLKKSGGVHGDYKREAL